MAARGMAARGMARGMVRALQHPARVIPVLFSIFLTIGTILLCLPISRANSDEPPNVLAAAFTAVSASCVTGLTVVDTATYWTTFGQFVIMVLIQVGGFGIMTMATLLAILVRRSPGAEPDPGRQSETSATTMGNVKGILRTVGDHRRARWRPWSPLSWRPVLRRLRTTRWPQALWQGVSTRCRPSTTPASPSTATTSSVQPGHLHHRADLLRHRRRRARLPGVLRARRRWRTAVVLDGAREGHDPRLFRVALVGCRCVFGVAEWNNPGTLGPIGAWGKLVNSVDRRRSCRAPPASTRSTTAGAARRPWALDSA
jgi:trk system potassium uptake protein TrkH